MGDGNQGGPAPLVARPALVASAGSARVVLISAPGGYGKTILANQMLDAAGRATVRALLDRPADPATLIDELRRGVRASGLTDTAALAERATDTDGVFAALAGRPEPTAVFVDEIQLLDDTAADALTRTLRGTPPGLLVILAGRRLPGALATLDGPGIARIDRGPLRLDVADTAAVLNVDDPATAEWVTTATDGWPAAIGLVAQLLRTESLRGPVLAGSTRFGAQLDRLVDRLVADLPSALQLALATIAAVPVLDAELLDEVWGPGTAALLADAGLAPRQRPDGWQSLPDPVRESLARRGRADAATAVRAARALASRGRLDTGVQMLVDFGELDALADLLAEQQPDALLQLGMARVGVLLAHVGPSRAAARPELLLAAAMAAEARDDPLRQRCLAAAGEATLGDAPAHRAVLAEQAADAVRFGDAATAGRLAGVVLADAGASEPFTRARALTAAAMAQVLADDSNRRLEARAPLEEAIELFRLTGASRRQAEALRRLGFTVEHHAGSPARAAELLGRALGLLGVPDRERALSLTYYAEVLEVAGQLDAADSAVREAAAIGARLDDDLARFYAAWTAGLLAAHRLDRGELDRHVADAERAAAVIAPGDASRFEFLITIADAYAGAGDQRQARALLDRARTGADDVDRATAVTMVEARLEALWGDPREALRLLDEIEHTPRSVPHQRWIRLLERAVAVRRSGDEPEAARLLSEAFRLTADLGLPDLPQRIEPWLLAQLDDVDDHAERTAPPTRITLLGRTTIVGATGDLTPPPGLPRSLVALVASRRTIASEEVIEVLWPDVSADTGRSRLRNLLNRVRERAGTVVVRDGDLLVLGDAVEVDIFAYERLADAALAATPAERVGLARHALAHWHGEPFEEHRYEAWAAGHRERLRRRHLSLLDIVVEADLADGNLDDAIRHVEAALAVDPLDEDRHVTLVAALAQQGRRGAAHTALAEALRVCAELGVAPSTALAHWQRRLAAPAPGGV